MGHLQTIPLTEDTKTPEPAWHPPPEPNGWKPNAIVADIATLGVGTVAAGLFNLGLVFVIPKLVSVEDFGYWRMFALYAGYVGFLHFGFADGALLRWAGRPLADFHHEIRPALKYLFYQHLLVGLGISTVAVLASTGPIRFIAIALTTYALIYNEVTLLQYALQSAKAFRPVALSTVGAPALFLGFALISHVKWHNHYPQITVFFVAGWLVMLVLLLASVRPFRSERDLANLISLVKNCIGIGWPIVFANTVVMMIVLADRLAVSWSANIQQFAQYSLAASAMAVPVTAIQVCSKVFFSHLAGVTPEARRRIYGVSSRFLLIAWALLLPYYFALDEFIHRFLPKYITSLAYARILLLSIPFLASIQILQMSCAYLNGMQKRFLVQSLVVLSLTLAATSLAAFGTHSLTLVAGVQVIVLAGWWLFNEWTLRRLSGESFGGWMKFLGLYSSASLSYWVTTASGTEHLVLGVVTYYLCVSVLLDLLCRDEVNTSLRMFRRRSREVEVVP